MYRIVLCDDEVEIVKKMQQTITKCFWKMKVKIECNTYSETMELIKYLEKNVPDVLFLDIDMPHVNGMDIAKMVTEQKLHTLIVFVTSHDILVYETFQYRPFAFMRKKYFEEEIDMVVKRICDYFCEQMEDLIFYRNQEMIKEPIKDIIYIEAEGNYVYLIKKDASEKYRDTLSSLEKKLVNQNFIRVHKGYLVQIAYIERLKHDWIIMEGGIEIPIGRSYEKEVRQKMMESFRR